MEEEVFLFEPTTKDLFVAYPELADYPEFLGLSQKELQMCWYIGNKTSPVYRKFKEEKEQRIKTAIKNVFQEEAIKASRDLSDMYSLKNIPARFEDAIKVFGSFDIHYRLKARIMYTNMLSNMEKMVIIKDDDFEDMGGEDYKNYVSTVKNAVEIIPVLIKKIEESGMRISKRTDGSIKNKIVASIDDIDLGQ
jgi:hypothetical protein